MNIDILRGFLICYFTMAVGALSEHSTIWFFKMLDDRAARKEAKKDD